MKLILKLFLILFFCKNMLATTNCIDDCLDEFGADHAQTVVACIKDCFADCCYENSLVHIHGPDMIKEQTCCN